jgi:type II secretory pathway predicted ATPase ExeA
MYEAFFNLKHKPFSLLPDPEFLFLSDKHAVALSLLDYCLSGQAGFCVITGEIGSGKTTLIRAFLGRVSRQFSVGLISNTHGSLTDIASWALNAFGQKASGTSPAETYQELMAHLIAEYGAGRQCILIVDEAQNLKIEALEELRLLSNINTGKDLLLQMVLVGQPELLDKLRRPELSQFAQRIAVSHHLTPLPYADTKQYIAHRLAVAGCDRPIFTEMATGAIHYFSGGVPRLINSICDMSLVYAFADGATLIDEELVFRVVADRQGSGIAPYAAAGSADDPDVRAQISHLTRSGTVSSAPVMSSNALPEPSPSADPAIANLEASLHSSSEPAVPAGPGNIEKPSHLPSAELSGNEPRLSDRFDDGELVLTVLSDDEQEDKKLVPSNDIASGSSPVQLAGWSAMKNEGLAVRHVNLSRSELVRSSQLGTASTSDSKPWPSVGIEQAGTGSHAVRNLMRPSLISEPEPGTAAPERRSWWRRSFSRTK